MENTMLMSDEQKAERIVANIEHMRENSQEMRMWRNIPLAKECLELLRSIHDDEAALEAMPGGVIEADVEVTELMGSEIYLYLTSEENKFVAKVSNKSKARAGDVIKVALDATKIHLFDRDTERFIVH